MALPYPKKNLNCLLKDLRKGQESASRLNDLVNGSNHHEASALLGHILDTFSKVISAIETGEAVKEHGAIESADAKITGEICSKKRKGFNGSDQKSRSRRSIRQASTREVRAKTIDDGQAWRKYGQKEILNSNNPRSYFRCTHKFDQGCKAQKQVQKSEDDPSIFIITYMGHHTCNNPSHLPEMIQNFSGDNSTCLISFESNAAIPSNNTNYNKKPGQDKTVNTPVQSLKQEGEEDMLSNLTMTDLTAGGVSDPMASSSDQAEDRGDVTSELNCFIGDPDMHLMMLNPIEDDFSSFSDYIIQFG